jgi:hypothetical protein
MGETEPTISRATVGRDGFEAIAPSDRSARSGIEPPKRRAAGAISALALMLEDWLPAFAGAASGAPSLRDGHLVQCVVDAARRSAAGAGWVAL